MSDGAALAAMKLRINLQQPPAAVQPVQPIVAQPVQQPQPQPQVPGQGQPSQVTQTPMEGQGPEIDLPQPAEPAASPDGNPVLASDVPLGN